MSAAKKQARFVLITAGGRGLRMGSAMPKQFVEIGGRPVLMHTLAKFYGCRPMAEIIVTLPADMLAYWGELCRRFAFGIPHRVVEGGATRFHSVANALGAAGSGLIAVHDGVRPFVSEAVIEACFAAAEEHGAAVPVVELADSLRELTDAEGGSRAVDRSRFVRVQTPQTFRSELLKEAYRQPYRPEFTDEAAAVEALGASVVTVPGNAENIKITSPTDLLLAELILQKQ